MSRLKKLAGETALYGMSSIVGKAMNFLLVPLYTRTLEDTGQYGVVSEFYAYSGFLMVLFSYRMESAFFRFGTNAADRENSYQTGLLSLMGSTLVFTAFLLAAAQPIADFLQYPGHAEYVRWFALILAFDCLAELPYARLRLEQRPGRFVTARLFNISLNILLNLFWLVYCPWAAKQGLGWVDRVWDPGMGVAYIFLSNMIASGATLLLLWPQLAGLRWAFDKVLWKKMMRYALPLVVVSFAGIVNEMLDRALMTRLLPGTLEQNRAELGIYGANYKLAMLIALFTQAYRYAAEPFFFRHAHEADAPQVQARVTKWFTIAASGGMLFLLLFLDLIKHFLDDRYHSGLHIVPILLLANLLLGIYYNFSVWYRLKDRTGTGAWIALGGAAITVALNIWWVPLMGYSGAAWATLACYAFMAAVTWWLGKTIYPVPYPLGRMGLYMILALGLYAASLWLPENGAVWAVRSGLFAVFCLLVFVLEKRDLTTRL